MDEVEESGVGFSVWEGVGLGEGGWVELIF